MNTNDGGGGRTGPYWRRQMGLEPQLDPQVVQMLLRQGVHVSGYNNQGDAGRQILPPANKRRAKLLQPSGDQGDVQMDAQMQSQLQNHMQGALAQRANQTPQHPEDLAQLLLSQHGSVNDAYSHLMQKMLVPRNSLLAPAVQKRQASRTVLQNALLGQLMSAQAQAHNLPAMQGYQP